MYKHKDIFALVQLSFTMSSTITLLNANFTRTKKKNSLDFQFYCSVCIIFFWVNYIFYP